DAPPDEVSYQLRQLIHLIVGEAVFDRDVFTFDVTRLLETLAKSAQLFAERIRRLAMEDPDYRHRRLLRSRRDPPDGRRAAEQRDELAPFQCPKPPVLPTEKIAHLSYDRRLLRCGISIRPLTAMGHQRPRLLMPRVLECPLRPRKRTCVSALRYVRLVPIVLQNDFAHSSAQD